jgi:hypothetical protein
MMTTPRFPAGRALPAAYVWCWLVATGATLAWAAFSPAPPTFDEQVNLQSSATIWYGQGSLITRLRSYVAPQGPVPFLLAGAPAGPDGSGVRGTRVLSALMASAALALAMFLGGTTPVAGPVPGPLLLGAALLLMPYFLFMSTHFYTDIAPLLGLLATMAFWYKGRYGWAGAFLALAVGSRQFAIFAWLGLAVVELVAPRGRRSWGRAAMLFGPAPLVLGALMLIWGGATPPSSMADEMRAHSGLPHLSFVNYYLACAGAYAGWTLWLRPDWKRTARPLLLALAASPIYWVALPGPNEFFRSQGIPISTLGFVDRILTAAVGSGAPRAILLWLLWVVGVLCLVRIALDWKRGPWNQLVTCWSLCFLAVHAFAPYAWDKYFLPLQVPLVLALASRPEDTESAPGSSLSSGSPGGSVWESEGVQGAKPCDSVQRRPGG